MELSIAGYGVDELPELYIEGIPEENITLDVVRDDLFYPIKPDFHHWVAWNKVLAKVELVGSYQRNIKRFLANR